ncbi:MFS transporter [Catenulispora pinisilvae]|uniref:MFS transporter n=1 Tax=Catenulispora pinisilvae TaxID=2705253 RepID=UPI0018910B43|nr:MFS transporter [Catenulispora pinisilvae]
MSTVNAGPVKAQESSTVRQRTFSSLKVPNYRMYMTGQSISLIGTWMQTTAQSWLVLTLTHSSTALGLVVALQTLPVLLFGPYGGVVADRADKQRLMVILQSAMGVQALVLGLLTVFGSVKFWEVCALAVALGMNNAFENATRQSFVREMVGRDELRNAITLNSVMVNAARAVGPAVGGILIAVVGIGICFLLNAASFVAVVASLLRMDRSQLQPSPPTPRARGQLREGLRYAAATPTIAIPLAMMGLVGLLAYEFQVSLPVFVERTFHGGSVAFGVITSAMGIGAVVGGLFTAARGRTGLRPMMIAAIGFGVSMLAAAYAPVFAVACAVMLLVGWASVSFIAIGNSTIQLTSDPEKRGRMIALWQVAFQGTTPIGGPLVGWVIAMSDPRSGLAVGGVSCLVAAAGGFMLARRVSARGAPAQADAAESPA